MLTEEFISYNDIDYTPDPIPMSMMPALILAAMIEHASNPEEQSLLTVTIVVVSGNPAKN